jgi:hypothetical protein
MTYLEAWPLIRRESAGDSTFGVTRQTACRRGCRSARHEIASPTSGIAEVASLKKKPGRVNTWAGATPVLGGLCRPSPRAFSTLGAGGLSRPRVDQMNPNVPMKGAL